MRTIQMTLDDDLVVAVDKVVKKLKTSRSAFTRKALMHAIKKQEMTALEQKHQMGYQNKPCLQNEFSVWEPDLNADAC